MGTTGGRIQLREWIVDDFKAISHVSTSLPPLTLLAGANSSGKSSLIQSLLFLAQSDDEDIVLNGPLVRLGDPVDVIRDGNDRLALGAVVEARVDDETAQSSQLAFRMELKDVAGGLQVSSFSIYLDDEPVLEATTKAMSRTKLPDLNAARSNLSMLRISELYGKRPPTRAYIGFGGLSPEAFFYRQKLSDNTRHIRRAVLSGSRVERAAGAELLIRQIRNLEDRDKVMSEWPFSSLQGTGLSALLNWDSEMLEAALEALETFTPESEWVPVQVARFAFTRMRGMRGVYQNELVGAERFSKALRSISVVSDAIRTLRASVRYLGPLRAEPRVVSPTGGDYRSLPVGSRGEFTADLLAHDKGRPVRFADWQGRVMTEPLPLAVSKWSNYLGIGDSVAVLDQGKLGRGLRVRVNGVERDLTTIGVGASQVLPVLALVLGAPRGSLILLEQPELHLHPAVQARLGDFFLFARPDVHVVVETHSEYLVTRIRLRCAQANVLPERVDVLFAEQSGGVSSMRSLDMNEFGDFAEWPSGFFDTQDVDARDLVSAIGYRLANEQ